MTKKRKIRTPEGEWESFVTKMLNRKRDKRDFTLPTTYLNSVADSLHKTNPSKEIILNTLKDLSSVIAEKFYLKAISDQKHFREKQDAHRRESFKREMTSLDELIHNKTLNNGSIHSKSRRGLSLPQ